jgi:hypothetical protein
MRSTAVAATPLRTHLTGTVTTLAQRLEHGLEGRYTVARELGQGGMVRRIGLK